MPTKGVVETKGVQGGAIKKGGGMAHDSGEHVRNDSQPMNESHTNKGTPSKPPTTTPKK
jgi:hypothetical protein